MITFRKRSLAGCALLLWLAAFHPSAQAQTIPNAPTNLSASVVSALQISLSWADVSTNEDGFKVERSLDGITFSQIAQVAAGVTNYRNAALFPGKTYSYRVRAYNSGGASAYSAVASATTPTPACPLAVAGWGFNLYGEVSPPTTLTNVAAIASGEYHSLALKSDDTVVGWGYDGDGEIDIPVALSNVVVIAAGGYHSLALKSDGTVIAWGYNGFLETTTPAGLSNVVAVSGGEYHSLALKSDGTVVGWGDNVFGEATIPVGLSNVVAIAAGYYHSLVLKSDGTVIAWGFNCCGQATPPAGLSNVVAIAAGNDHDLALKSDGTVVGWGYNAFGETTSPAGLTGVTAIAAGGFHSMALRSDGTAVVWGNNGNGQSALPPGLTGVSAIADGGYSSLVAASVPGPPAAFAATPVGGNEIDLSWSEYSSGVTSFEIDRAPDAGGSPGTWAQIATLPGNVSTYHDTGVVANTTYWYRMRAYNSCSASPYSALKVPTTLVLDDTWSTGVRTNQNLPTSSAWWTSTAGTLDAVTNNMTLIVGSSSAVQAMTYFTPDANSPPIQLNIGDTLTATFKFIPSGIPQAGSSSQGFRFGLFDFADGNNVPKRASSDGFGSEGSSVAGYALFGKFYGKFSDATPIDIRKRINLSDASLMGTSGDFTSLAKDSLNTNGFGGFANLTPYSLQFILQRTGLNSMVITITWSNMVTGATLSDSVTDNSASNFSFDGIAYRPQNSSQAPATNDFQEATITVSSTPRAPSVAVEPQPQSVFEGQNPTFTVIPNGTLPLSYQWYDNTSSPIANATNSTLTLTGVHLADAGGYSVLLSNPYGAVTSAAGQLTVGLAAPSISAHPQNLTVIPGQFATFSVMASGSQPLIYQWYHNTNTLLITATGPSAILTNVQPADAGSYSVVVSNIAGSVTSSNAILTVNTNPAAPVFITQPVSLHVYAGDTATFTGAAVGTQPILYQWTKNAVPIPGANASALTLTNAQPSDAGTYSLVASNSVGSTPSTNATLTVTLKSPPLLPNIPTNQFNVTNFGAVGDGVANNAAAIQSTINAAAAAGGGTVEIPAAGALSNYLSGPIILSNNVNLKIDGGAMLQMLPRSNWPGTTAFISGTTLHDVEISGLGTVDGQGTNWWFPLAGSRPNFINFSGCTNVLIQDVTLQNPPTFHLMLKGNNAGITIQGITINTPGDSPNTDGMDLASTNVLIRNCFISDGDDNIEIGGSALAADITVSNCTFGTGHGVSIGSITSGGVHDIIVSNCAFNGTVNGIRMKSDNDRGGLIQNLQYLDITMTNVAYPITIYSYYNQIGTPNNISPGIASVQPVAPVTSLTPIWQNILISNLTVVATTGLNIDGIIWGRTEMLVSNVTLYDVNITAPTNTFVVYNAQGIQFINSHIATPTSTNTFTLYNAQITISNSAPNATLVTLGGLAIPPTNNTLAFFNAQAAITDTNLLGPSPYLTLGGSTLTANNGLNLGSASTLNFALGVNATEIVVPGNLVLGGTLNIADAGGLTAATYTLFAYSGALTYNGLAIGATPNTNFIYTISTNIVGQVNLVVTSAAPPLDPFVAWQLQYFNCTNCPQAAGNADPDGDGTSNTNEFLLGTNPTSGLSGLRILSVTRQGADISITWRTAGGRTNIVQATGTAGYTTNFSDISVPIITQGSGDTTTNYVDSGGATNAPSRYYRVRLVP